MLLQNRDRVVAAALNETIEMGGGVPRFGAAEVVGIGRVGIDLYPMQNRTRLAQVERFGRFLGGSSANVMVAAARHGRRSALIARTGDDAFGEFIREELERFGVDASGVIPDSRVKTTLAFCELFPPDDFPLTFYRDATAPESLVEASEVSTYTVRRAKLLWLAATGFATEPSRLAHEQLLAIGDDAPSNVAQASVETSAGRIVAIDLDYRPGFWNSDAEARERLSAALPYVDVAVGNQKECEIAVGETDPDRQADALLALGVQTAIVKLGPKGVLAADATDRVLIPPTPVDVVNGLGAGDAFGGALIHGLLSGWPLDRTASFASAAGAIVAGRRECAAAMPTTAEVEAVLAGGCANDV